MGTRLFEGRTVLVFSGLVSVIAFALLWPGIVEYVTTGAVTLHWSRVVTGVFGFILVAQSAVAIVALRVLRIWRMQIDAVEVGRRAASLERRVTNLPGGASGGGGVLLPSRPHEEDLEPCPF